LKCLTDRQTNKRWIKRTLLDGVKGKNLRATLQSVSTSHDAVAINIVKQISN